MTWVRFSPDNKTQPSQGSTFSFDMRSRVDLTVTYTGFVGEMCVCYWPRQGSTRVEGCYFAVE